MRTRYALPFCIVVASALAITNGQAFADDAMADTARELYLKAAKAAEQQKWDQCRAALLAALAIKQHPQVAGSLGGCEVKLRLYRDAAEHLAYSLREMKTAAPAERRTNTEAVLREAQEKIQTVRLSVNVRGADVRVDGRSVGTAPLPDPIFLDPGPHTIEAVQEGFQVAHATVEGKAGNMLELELALKRNEPTTPPAPLPSPPPPLAPTPRPLTWLLVTSGVLAAGGLAAGAGLTVAANGKGSDVATLGAQVGGPSACLTATSSCTTLHNAASSRDELSSAALWSFVGSGAFALTTVGLGVWTMAAPKANAPVQIVPTIGAALSGVEVRGSW